VDRVADAAPDRGVGQVPVEPDDHGLADHEVLGDEADLGKAAVAAVVAVIAHEEVVAGRHHVVEIV